MATKSRIRTRHKRDYDIRITGKKNYSIGTIEMLSWFPLEEVDESGFNKIAVSFKLSDLPDRIRVNPTDVLQLSILGKVSGRTYGESELMQQLKIVPKILKEIDDKTGKMKEIEYVPEEFEEGGLYQFIGLMSLDEDELIRAKPKNKIGVNIKADRYR